MQSMKKVQTIYKTKEALTRDFLHRFLDLPSTSNDYSMNAS